MTKYDISPNWNLGFALLSSGFAISSLHTHTMTSFWINAAAAVLNFAIYFLRRRRTA